MFLGGLGILTRNLWISTGNHMISSAKLFWKISECSLVSKAYKIEQACRLSAIIGSLIGSLYITC